MAKSTGSYWLDKLKKDNKTTGNNVVDVLTKTKSSANKTRTPNKNKTSTSGGFNNSKKPLKNITNKSASKLRNDANVMTYQPDNLNNTIKNRNRLEREARNMGGSSEETFNRLGVPLVYNGVNPSPYREGKPNNSENTSNFGNFDEEGNPVDSEGNPSQRKGESTSSEKEQSTSRRLKSLLEGYTPATFQKQTFNPETGKTETETQSYFQDEYNNIQDQTSNLRQNYDNLREDQKAVFDVMGNILNEDFVNRVRGYMNQDRGRMYNEQYSDALYQLTGGETPSIADKVLAGNRAKQVIDENNPFRQLIKAVEQSRLVNKGRGKTEKDAATSVRDLQELAGSLVTEENARRTGVTNTRNQAIAQIIQGLLGIEEAGVSQSDSIFSNNQREGNGLKPKSIIDEETINYIEKQIGGA